MNDLLYLFFFILCVAGAYSILREVVFPISDVILFATGYTAFNVWRIDPKKLKTNIHLLPKFIIRCFGQGVQTWASSGTVDEVSSGGKHWKPYFHYWSGKK